MTLEGEQKNAIKPWVISIGNETPPAATLVPPGTNHLVVGRCGLPMRISSRGLHQGG
jgi:hypothetical protein